jgi:hypothetical protein
LDTFRSLASLLGCLGLSLLTGCSPEAMMDKFTTPEDKARASGFIQNLRDGRLDVIEVALDPQLKSPNVRATLEQMRAMIPEGEPDSVKLVGVSTETHNGIRSSNLTYEYEFDNRWFLINCATRLDGDQERIFGLNVTPLDASIESKNRFTLAGKTPLHYSMLAAIVLAVGLTLYALVRCVRHKALRKKWAWVLFILVGAVTFSLNWTTGEWLLKPLHFQLFSAGASASPYGPWEFSVAVPLGALLYLLLRGRHQNAVPQSNSEPAS